ncbi:MAG TPA: YlxR family protein [Actinomycetota bacterium]
MPSDRQPERTCLGCRQKATKPDLVRVVRRPDGEIAFDPTGHAPGRGAYLHPSDACVRRAVRANGIARALKIAMSAQRAASLIREVQNMRSEEP